MGDVGSGTMIDRVTDPTAKALLQQAYQSMAASAPSGSAPITKWNSLYSTTPAAGQYGVNFPGFGDPNQVIGLDEWWQRAASTPPTLFNPNYYGTGTPTANSPAPLATSLDWAAQNNAKVQVVAISKPGQSVPPNPQPGSVPATGSGASVVVDTTTTNQSPAYTGFDWSSLLSGDNLLIGGAVLVGLVLVMGMGKGRN